MNRDERPTKIKSNLVALSTVALLTVYAAGYARTRAAAQRFAGADAERQPATPVRPPVSTHDTVTTTVIASAASAPSHAATIKHDPLPAASPAVRPPAPTIDSALPAIASTVIAAPPAADTSRAAIAGQAVDSSVQAADKLRAQYKDGVYTGWGTSRHGDIQASVEIKDGRIVAASIAQCLTRYSCSWISHLPGQIVARQGADVDLVSGATQSTNAFYYAIVEALSKAK